MERIFHINVFPGRTTVFQCKSTIIFISVCVQGFLQYVCVYDFPILSIPACPGIAPLSLGHRSGSSEHEASQRHQKNPLLPSHPHSLSFSLEHTNTHTRKWWIADVHPPQPFPHTFHYFWHPTIAISPTDLQIAQHWLISTWQDESNSSLLDTAESNKNLHNYRGKLGVAGSSSHTRGWF